MKFQTLDAFEKHLRASYPHQLEKIYGVIAPSKSDREGVIERLKKGFLTIDPHLQVVELNGATLNCAEVQNILETQSLFSPNNLVILLDLEKAKKSELETLGAVWDSVPDGSRIVFTAASSTGLKELLSGRSFYLDLMQEKPWDRKERCVAHLIHYARRASVQLQADAAELIVDYIGQEIPDLEKECEKLICYAGVEGRIDSAAVDKLVPMRAPLKRFKISQEWVFGSAEIVAKDFEGSDLFQWLGQIRYHLQMGLKMLFSPSDEIKSQMNPKEFSRLSKIAGQLGSAYFENGLTALTEIEMIAKQGSLSDELLLQMYIGKLDYARKTHSSA